jgi:hypothetical protein
MPDFRALPVPSFLIFIFGLFADTLEWADLKALFLIAPVAIEEFRGTFLASIRFCRTDEQNVSNTVSGACVPESRLSAMMRFEKGQATR